MAKGEKKTRDRKAGEYRVSQAIRDKRLIAIAGWMAQGLRTKQIHAAVADAGRFEREHRAEYREALRLYQEAAARGDDMTTRPMPSPPALVWGELDPPVSTRQVDYYIRTARQNFRDDGRELSNEAAEVLGVTWHRLNDLYRRALDDKRYAVCERLIGRIVDIFGLRAADPIFRPSLIGRGGIGPDGQLPGLPGQPVPIPADEAIGPETGVGASPRGTVEEGRYTPAQLAAEWDQLTTRALERLRATGVDVKRAGG